MRPDALIAQLRAVDQDDTGRTQVPAGYNVRSLAMLDQAALVIRGWDERVVPGLLQHPWYSRAIARAADPDMPAGKLRDLVDRKALRKQAFLSRVSSRNAPSVQLIVSQRSIEQHLTEQQRIHVAQLGHLLRLSAHSRIGIQVMPASLAPDLTHHMLLYKLSDTIEPRWLVYTETPLGGIYSTRRDDLERMRDTFRRIGRQAMDVDSSREYIRELFKWRTSKSTSSESTEDTASPSVNTAERERTVLEWPEQTPRAPWRTEP